MSRIRRPKINPPGRLARLRLSPQALSRLFLKIAESKVIRKGVKTPCWEWLAYKDKNGYGKCSVLGKKLWCHRAFYAIFNGPIKEGNQIDHKCHNTSCCNPHHLVQKLPLKNAQEGGRHGVKMRGVRAESAKTTTSHDDIPI